jgi:fermentation-respiration switch protein FrsA (DUF1100 family)
MTSAAWIAVLVLAAATPPQQAPAAPVTQAQAIITDLAAQKFAAVVAQFDAAMKTGIPEPKLAATWTTLVGQLGALRRQGTPRTSDRDGLRIVVIPAEFERGAADIQVVFDAAGLVAGLSIRPAVPSAGYTPPSYAKLDAFTEEDVTIGTGEWALPGTLSMPAGAGPFAAIVLVHGSGPSDRDASVSMNKPFRDLALGLASRGVAVLRYEKRTRQHAARLGTLKTITVKDETIDDAVLAVALLRLTQKIDPRRIVVLGHSLGGMLVPRIAAADARIAGFIVLAGAVRSLDQSLIDQARYIAEADGTVTPDEQRRLDEFGQLQATVRALRPGPVDEGRALLGAPAAYWLDLRGYDAPVAARAVTAPMLILQGERDYQVTMEDFGKWKTALASKTNATFRSYPPLNHLFLAGSGKSLPAEYSVPGHVAEDVIADIVRWIGTIK